MQTDVLTIWRTLHIEQDSMGPPAASDLPFADDDVPVADVRDATLSLMQSKFLPANIDVAADLAEYEDRGVLSDNTFFMMNLSSSFVGEAPSTAANGMGRNRSPAQVLASGFSGFVRSDSRRHGISA